MNACDITVKSSLKIAFQKTRNYYNDNNIAIGPSYQTKLPMDRKPDH